MTKFLSGFIYGNIYGFIYFVKSKYSFKNKIRVFLTAIRIDIKFIFLAKLLKIPLKKENILGYKINAFDYEAIRVVFQEIFFRSQYFVKLENKKPVIFDCGANIGLATIFFKWIYPECAVYAFEPDEDTFKLLEMNIRQNKLKNVNLFNVALTDKEGKIDFFVDKGKIGSLMMSENFGRMPKDKITVNAVSLPKFIEEKSVQFIDLVKMDIEGSEKKVIEDLDRNNSFNKISNFIIEYHHKISREKSNLGEFLKIFEKNNFEYQIDSNCIPIDAREKFQDILIYAYIKINH